MRPDQAIADWRDGEAYAALLGAERPVFAWEWLRRDPSYRSAARLALRMGAASLRAEAQPEHWGLHAFEPPQAAAPHARPMWSAFRLPAVLHALAEEAGPAEGGLDLLRLAVPVRIVGGDAGGEHLLISDGLRSIRIDLLAGTATKGPIRLRYLLSGLAEAERPLLSLRRLLALARNGRFSMELHPRDPRARRSILLLRAWDALCEGADQREIAGILLDPRASGRRWRSDVPSLRSQAQRLVRGARQMARGGYLALLR